ncbi:hypothetical protein [Flavobacterium sp. LB2R40]|uniref:hypothetical protein n=1 Tax=Flavobacterium sp. LB2R40 TaxID=3401722 RepID=UPI003AABD175
MAQLDMFGGNGNDNTFPKTGLNKIISREFIYLPNFFSKFEMIFSIASNKFIIQSDVRS